MNKENKLIPELRFPEFKNEGEWVEKKLGEVCKMQAGKFVSASEINAQFNKDLYPCYGGNGLRGFTKSYTHWGAYSLIGRQGALCGNVILADGKFHATEHAVVVTPEINIDTIWLSYVLELLNLNQYATGQAQPGLSVSNLEQVKLNAPKNPKEQQKIASCLSSLDELLAAHSQKLDLLKDHKKGLMQNFFPQEGENAPKVRFSEFKNDGNWIKETVGDVYEFKVSNSFAREYLNYKDGSVKNIHYGDIHTKFNTLFDITKENVPFINPDVTIEKIRKESYCIAGDMVFADASEDMNDVGKSIEIVNINNENLVSGLHTLLARQREKKLSIGFGGYLFKSDWIRKQIQREAQGAKVLGISATRISNAQILYPKNHKEQQKISSCLSSLDALIKAQAEKIEQLKWHKKGLMQGLFPKINNENV